tara:strand:+ start:3853 stop:5196 length:1344 start_codon:yes stop_codon:yes gene_type:complete
MGEAAKISLKAIGKQDTFLLSKDPEESFFNYTENKRHTDFRKYHRSKRVLNPGQVQNWPFAQSVKVKFEPKNMGDLLSNMYLSIKMPALNTNTSENYADQLGRHILKSVTMFVDDIEVEKIHDDWGIIYDELYLETSEKVANRFLVNRNLGFDASESLPSYAKFESDLVIPLQFFFTRKYSSDEYSSNSPNRPYFPLCAVYKQKIEFEFEFHKQTFFTDTSNTLELPFFDIITEEITVTGDERIYMMKERQTIITDFVRKHPTTESDEGKSIIRNNLVPNIPVKCIHWFLRNTKFEDEDVATGNPVPSEDGEYLIHNRFNFSSNVNFDQTYTFFSPVMKSGSFYINGNKMPNVSDTGHNYYKYLIPSQKRLSRPIRNIYTYSFSMNPVNVEPSGNLDFSGIKSDKTAIELELDTSLVNINQDKYTLHMYYTGYQTMIFDNGFMSFAY